MKKILTSAVLIAFCLPIVFFAQISKAESKDVFLQVSQNCSRNRQQIAKLRSSDAFKRVSLGQNYESILSLMEKLNTRIVVNKLNVANLIAEAANFNELFTKFKSDYQSYERELTALGNIDCQKDAQFFLQQLTRVRYLRTEINDDTKKLNQSAKIYFQEVEQFKGSLK